MRIETTKREKKQNKKKIKQATRQNTKMYMTRETYDKNDKK